MKTPSAMIALALLAMTAAAQTWVGTNFGAAAHEVDPGSGHTLASRTLTGLATVGINDLAVDPTSGSVLAIDGGFTRTRALVALDLASGVATTIGPLPDGLAGLAFTPDGALWGVTGDGGSPPRTLFAIAAATAAATPVAALIDNGNSGEVLAADPSGVLFRVDGAVLSSIDPITATETFVADLRLEQPGFGEASGIDVLGDGSLLLCDTAGILYRRTSVLEVVAVLTFGTPRGILELGDAAVEYGGTGEIDTSWAVNGSSYLALSSGVNDSVALMAGDVIALDHQPATGAPITAGTGELVVIGSFQATGPRFVEVFPALFIAPSLFAVLQGSPLFPLVLPMGYSLVYPGGAAGSSLLLQCVVVSSAAGNGIFASAHGFELILS